MAQRGFAPAGFAALQIAQVDGADGALGQTHAARHLAGGGGFTSLPYSIFEAPAVRRLGGQLRVALGLDSAVWTADAVAFDQHRGLEFKAREVAHLALVDGADMVHTAAALGAGQFTIAAFAAHAQSEQLARFVDVGVVHPESGPSQDFGPVCMHKR